MFLYFTVNPGQTAKWESGFFMEVYIWRAFYRPFALRGHVTSFL